MATNPYSSPEPRTVKLFDVAESTATIEWLYFFLSKVKTTDVSALGQTPAATLPADGKLITATNIPRPYRARNKASKISSFCSADKVQTARTSGWSIKGASFASERAQEVATFTATDTGSVIVFVEALARPGGTETINYAWYLPRKLIAKATLASIQALGIQFPNTAAEWKGLVFGGGGGAGDNKKGPRPAKAKKVITGGTDGTDTVTTFYAHGTTLTAEWQHAQNAIQFTG